MRLCFAAVALCCGTALAQPADSLRSLSGHFQSLADRVKPAVVQIMTTGFTAAIDGESAMIRTRSGSGSGIIVDACAVSSRRTTVPSMRTSAAGLSGTTRR